MPQTGLTPGASFWAPFLVVAPASTLRLPTFVALAANPEVRARCRACAPALLTHRPFLGPAARLSPPRVVELCGDRAHCGLSTRRRHRCMLQHHVCIARLAFFVALTCYLIVSRLRNRSWNRKPSSVTKWQRLLLLGINGRCCPASTPRALQHPLSRPARPNPITHQPPTLRRAPRPHKFTAAHISPLAPTDGPLCCAPGRSYLEMAFEPHHQGGALAHLLLRL